MGKLDIDNLTYEQFVGHVRSALHYLYDPVHLRNSPLVEMLGLTDEFDRASALQQLLSAAIRGLKPSVDEAPQSRSWRIYDTLNFLYLRQLERDAVALQLGISERQLRREQRVAIERVAQHFWSRINTPVNGASIPAQTSDTPVLDTPTIDSAQALSEELIWLKNPASEQRITLSEAIHTVQTLAQPLAQQWQVSLQTDVQPDLAETIVSPLALRSILLTILGVAIPRASESIVTLSARQVHGEITCTVLCCNNSCNQMALSEKEKRKANKI